jgi:hypothetical protein
LEEAVCPYPIMRVIVRNGVVVDVGTAVALVSADVTTAERDIDVEGAELNTEVERSVLPSTMLPTDAFT